MRRRQPEIGQDISRLLIAPEALNQGIDDDQPLGRIRAIGDRQGGAIEGGGEKVRERRERHACEMTGRRCGGQSIGEGAAGMGGVDRRGFGGSEHDWRLDQQQPGAAGKRHRIEIGAGTGEERVDWAGIAVAGTLDRRGDSAMFGGDDGAEQSRLVGEVMVERAARHADGLGESDGAGCGVAFVDKAAPRRREQCGCRGVGAIPVGAPLLHTYSLYVNSLNTYRLSVSCGGGKPMQTAPMRLTSFYPVLMTDRVAATAAFYRQHFGFRAVFTADWYVHLQATTDPAVNLAILDGDHDTIPAAGRGRAGGFLLNFEVADVDTDYARLKAAGLPILLDLRSEPFGQRHFITADPNGVLIDVITPIPPSPEFAALFQDGAG